MATPVANDSTLAVLAPFEVFQAARLDFAQDLARLAAQGRPGAASLAHEVDSLEKILAALEASDTLVMDIAPLVADLAPSVQQSAMIAMGRMCSLSSSLCIKVAQPDLLRHVVETVTRVASPSLLKAALFFLHASALSSADVAIELVELGVLAPLCERVEALDPGTKTDAVWCLAAIAKHNAELAKAVANSGVLPLLKLCLKEPSLPLRRITLSCIGCIGQHSEELASILSKDGLLADILPMLRHRDLVLRRHACRALAVSVQHLSDLGFWKPEATTDLLACLGSASAGDAETAAYGAALVGQLCKGSNSVAGACNEGGAGPLLTALLRNPKAPTVPVALALGHLCSASAASAAAALDHGALDALLSLLEAQPPMHVCAALTVCMGAIGGADAGCAATFAASGALLAMARATILSRRKMSTTTTAAARGGVIAALSRCIDYPSLVQLFEETPLPAPASDTPPPSDGSAQPLDEAAVYAALLKALAAAFAKNGNHRHDFMSRGHLAHVQAASKCGELIGEGLAKVNAAFPAQMVKASQNPDYEKQLLAQIVDK